jgi:hypothetical protein
VVGVVWGIRSVMQSEEGLSWHPHNVRLDNKINPICYC